MNAEQRRKEIVGIMMLEHKPVSGGHLSEILGVSRQIIVQDISALKAAGYEILSTHSGYVLHTKTLNSKVFKVIHSDEDVQKELNLIVDLGGIVDDVFVYHKVYNKVTAPMGIKSRHDVEVFVNSIASGKSSLLKNVTSGYHYHTVLAENAQTLDLIEKKLKECGFLAKLQEYEPEEIISHM
ncbi:MAG: transcription repressor NadR [Clostridia bacterium]|nr:transcription repressor NadR [Clostridia bacterium]